jgi:hypothetical protein
MTDTGSDRFRNILALCLVGAFVSVLPFLIFKDIPGPNKDIITYMVGQLSGMATTALGFYFVNKVGADALEAKKADNTAKAFDAIAATAAAGGQTVALQPGEAAVAAPVSPTQGA